MYMDNRQSWSFNLREMQKGMSISCTVDTQGKC